MLNFLQKQGAPVELAELLVEVLDACRRISGSIVETDMGYAGTKNSFGEDQVAMDVMAEDILAATLKTCPFIAAYSSEELDEMVTVREEGMYSAFYDPLDGSSLINVNMSVGTIMGIYEGAKIMGRTGREQVAALFACYGPRTTVMLTVGNGVHELMLVNGVWEVSEERVELKGDKKYFAPGNLRACAQRADYFDLVSRFIQEKHTLRYSGGMVPDVNHILKKGSGVFMYPGMPGMEDGKLRLLYECAPMSLLMEQAGGAGHTGVTPVLDLEITSLVQRCPIFVGQADQVDRVVQALS